MLNPLLLKDIKMNRSEKIDALVNEMDDWDLETLRDWAKETRREMLQKFSSDAIDEECRANGIV